ncbi:ABC transporter ATP-binding protein [Alphaproteobacteria bacterium]|nr:ABC transporter ATP-binding protein [Alphaproteobacteria bacterium]
MNNLIEINNLKKKFHLLNENELLIFENLYFSITKNSITSIVGSSGCGKSTLLNILGLLDSNFEGKFLFEGKATNSMSSNQLSNIRNKKIGFIHQFFNLIPELSVLENVILPGLISKNKESVVNKEACEILDIFGILDKKNIKPNKLSGGEQQRVASARALINKPDLILADEMTGNLDENTSDEIINFFLKFIDSNNISLLYVTHNQKYADMANNKYQFKNKKLILK